MRRVVCLLVLVWVSWMSIRANPDELRSEMSIIRGKVHSNDEVMPLKYAFIGVYNEKGILQYTATTNEDGTFSLLIPAGWYSLVAVYDGYEKAAFNAIYLSPMSYTEFYFEMDADCLEKQYYLNELCYWKAFTIKREKDDKETLSPDFKFRIMDSSSKMLRMEYNTKVTQRIIAEIFNDYGELVYTFEQEIYPEKQKYYERVPELESGNYFLILNKQQHLNREFTVHTDR